VNGQVKVARGEQCKAVWNAIVCYALEHYKSILT